MTETTTTVEKTDTEKAQIAKDATALGQRPVKTTLDIVREKMAEAKKGMAGGSQGAEQPAAIKADAPVVKEGREADGKFAKSDATKEKETVAREERALQGLRRAKVSSTILDKLSDEDRIQMGSDLADGQAEQDRRWSEKGGKKESREEEPSKDGQPQRKADDLPKAESKPLADALALDEDGLKGLDAYGRSLVEPLREQLKASDEANDALAEHLGAVALDSVLTRLVGEFPELSDAKTRAEIVATANRLADGADIGDGDVMSFVDGVARDAIWRVCRDSIKARRGATEAANSAAKRLGQPTTGARHGDVPLSKPTTTLERVQLARSLMTDHGMSASQAEAEIKRRLWAP